MNFPTMYKREGEICIYSTIKNCLSTFLDCQ